MSASGQSASTSTAATAIVMVSFLAASASGFCPHACTCDEALRSAACPGTADLDIIPITLNPNIESLVLAGNRIKTVDASIQFYRKLQRADFSDNRYEFALCRRQKNERLDLYLPMNFPLLSIPRISVLPDSRLNSQKLLRNLTLDSNKIANLTNLTFVGLRSLRRLSMRENLIRELRPNVFAHLEKVRLIWCRGVAQAAAWNLVGPSASDWHGVAQRRMGRLFHAANCRCFLHFLSLSFVKSCGERQPLLS